MRFLGFLEEKMVYYCLDDPVWILNFTINYLIVNVLC
jgi:hypothetical protein